MKKKEVPPHVKHGGSNAYANYKCRCEPCRRGQGIRNKEYRLRDPEKFNAQRRAEYKANPERVKAINKKVVDRRRRILSRYKRLKGCLICGYRANPAALQFHHRDPSEKEFTVSMHIGKGWKKIKSEVRKCDVYCANCHMIEHYQGAA